MLHWFKQLICRHNLVRVVRWHPDVVGDDIKDKLLYVDDLNVHNFVQCKKCGQFLNTNQKEKLRGQKDETRI